MSVVGRRSGDLTTEDTEITEVKWGTATARTRGAEARGDTRPSAPLAPLRALRVLGGEFFLTAVAFVAGIAGCRSGVPGTPSPTPTPPPSVTPGSRAQLAEDGRVRYHLVIRADAGVAFLPISVAAVAGTGGLAWTRWTDAAFRYDEAGDRYVPADDDEDGARREEWVNVVFPGSNQEVSIPVRYGEAPPREERFEVVYATMDLGDLGRRIYVKPEKTPAGRGGEAVARSPLGERLRSVDVSRWLASGFFVRDEATATVEKHVVTVPGLPR